MQSPVVVVSDLSIERSGRLAVEEVSFALQSESETAVVGPNGAGKSTLVAGLLGLLPRKSGKVQILGAQLSANGDLSAEIRSQIAYVPQSLALQGRFPLTVAEFVSFGFDPPGPHWPWRQHRQRRAAAENALDRTGCIDLRNRLLSELSGGQLKRVMLSFCVVRPRQLLVLDEAQAGLDVPSNERFQQLLLELRRQEGWTVLHVSHDLDMVRRSSDQVLGLNRRLCCSGSPDHTLTPERLIDLYGPNMVPYRHQCHG